MSDKINEFYELEAMMELKRLQVEEETIGLKIKGLQKDIGADMVEKSRVTPQMIDILKQFQDSKISDLLTSKDQDQFQAVSRAFEIFREAKEYSLVDLDYLRMMDLESQTPQGLPFPYIFGLTNIYMRHNLLTVIGARPGVGKTTFALNLIDSDIKNNKPCVIFSLEMTARQILAKLVSMHIYYDKGLDLDYGNTVGYFRKHRDELKGYIARIRRYCIIIDASRWKSSKIVSRYNYLRDWYYKEYGFNFEKVYIDYFQRIRKEASGNSDNSELNDTLSILTNTAKQSDNAWLLLSQENRMTDKKNMDKSATLKGTGNLEEDTGLLIILKRESNELTGGNKPELQIIVNKNRFGPKMRTTVYLAEKSGAIKEL